MVIKISDDFEGSMLGGHRIEENRVFIDIKKEELTKGYTKIFNYNHHFHFKIFNQSEEENEITFYIGCENVEELDKPFVRIWVKRENENKYHITTILGKMHVPGKYFFKLKIGKKESYFISNYYPIPYSKLIRRIEKKIQLSSARKKMIGKTVEGRDIFSCEYGDLKKKPVLLFVSGYHPPEMEPIAIEAIMGSLENEEFRNQILEKFSIVLIPFLNPDGFANSMQGSNIKEINFHWRFFGNSIQDCPESHHIWNYCQEIKPAFFMDFHIFTFQNNEARPYIISPCNYSNKISKGLMRSINSSLINICKGDYSTSEKILAPNILSTQLRDKIGTVTSPKFHLHAKDGEVECQNISQRIFKRTIEIFDKYGTGELNSILLSPYGSYSNPKWFRLYKNIQHFFLFRLLIKIR